MLFERFDGKLIDAEVEDIEFFLSNEEYRAVVEVKDEEEGELDF